MIFAYFVNDILEAIYKKKKRMGGERERKINIIGYLLN
jgi:hypothetical protein